MSDCATVLMVGIALMLLGAGVANGLGELIIKWWHRRSDDGRFEVKILVGVVIAITIIYLNGER